MRRFGACLSEYGNLFALVGISIDQQGKLGMKENSKKHGGSVEPFPEAVPSTTISDELERILALLRSAFPHATHIGFEFDGRLHAHIDLRRTEEINLVEERLPYLGGGRLFSTIHRGKVPNHPFHHRVSALVAR
jgi:hypothetical protein